VLDLLLELLLSFCVLLLLHLLQEADLIKVRSFISLRIHELLSEDLLLNHMLRKKLRHLYRLSWSTVDRLDLSSVLCLAQRAQ
jgi:hypothetical protein